MKGFEFTLMVVGASRLGKSTLANSMFRTNLYSGEFPGPSQKTVEIEANKIVIKVTK